MADAPSHPTPRAALHRVLVVCLLGCAIADSARAQGPGITSPGMPGRGEYGQSDRFSRDFNPAISLAADLLGDWVEVDGDREASGADFSVRRLDLLLASWIDPRAWIYTVIAYENDELELDELAIQYVGLPGNHTLRGGRFLVDFGKQMQAHPEELSTIERPLVLREYLAEELSGDGVQWDWWTGVGERTMLRTSVGLFADLSGHRHGSEEAHEGVEAPEPMVPARLDLDEINPTLRLTAMTETGERQTLQIGASLRSIPSFSLSLGDATLDELSNQVWGLDLTWARNDPSGTRGLTLGGELLIQEGDLGATPVEADPSPGLEPIEGSVFGYYAWGEWRFGRYQSTGLQYSSAELTELGTPTVAELDLWYTRFLSDFLRLRAGVTWLDGHDRDAVRFALQVTALVGPHGHGLNW